MTKIQIDLSHREDKLVSIYKIVKDLPTKKHAIKHIIRTFDKLNFDLTGTPEMYMTNPVTNKKHKVVQSTSKSQKKEKIKGFWDEK